MISRASNVPEDVLVIRTTDPLVVLRDKGKFAGSRNLLLRASAYENVRHRTVLKLRQIKVTKMENRTRKMVIISKKDGEGEPRRIKPDSSAGIYVTVSVEA